MSEPDTPVNFEDMPEPPKLRYLRVLVTVLTATMILGLLTIIVLIVIKIMQPPAPVLKLPDTLSLPYGEKAQAITQGLNWIGVVTRDKDGAERFYVLNLDGTTRQVVEIAP